MMQPTTRSWEQLRSSARAAERTLEDKIASYTAISRAQVRSSMAPYDEENPPEQKADEIKLAVDIEKALTSLSDTIDEMGIVVDATSSKMQDAMLQRYRELYFDFKTEFRRSMVNCCQFNAYPEENLLPYAKSALQEKRDAQRLYCNRSHIGHSEDAEMNSLLTERRAVDSSRSMASSIIEQAMATRSVLESQRRQFTSSHGKVAMLRGSFVNINSLVEQIRRKKMRNNTIFALLIAGCICFSLWWIVLSNI
ncbi:hypothetical protein PsorP6_003661 [Peronosclerospora sorghi]|uniref:Uncharacterized protein n=1 Tax=Peronosclerospora sorghi TaxID=230839 RepID=A0ACC0VLB0_9STRA|nr:hypothetical protein PsorP6_003661 [Peronosclerospora sorghi]